MSASPPIAPELMRRGEWTLSAKSSHCITLKGDDGDKAGDDKEDGSP